VLLTLLEEGILALPDARHGETYRRVHPEFRAIFTSNPEEYAGVHKTQDALLNRMITIALDYYDRETEVAITRALRCAAANRCKRSVQNMDCCRRTNSERNPPTG